MRQIVRYGIEFDVCPATGGLWLDKGELEKLISLVREETLAEDSGGRRREHARADRRIRDDDDDDEDGHRGGDRRRRSRLADIFDF